MSANSLFIISQKAVYNFEGKPLTVTDPNSNVISYSYNKRGFLEKTINPDGGTMLYAYDLSGRKTDEVMPKNYDSTKSIQDMERIVYKYDIMGRVITKGVVFTEKKYDASTGIWLSSLASKVEKAYKYDSKGLVIKEVDAAAYDISACASIDEKISNAYGTEYKYNLAGEPVEILDPVTKDKGLPYTLKNEYDAINRKTKETDAKGRIKTIVYDTAGNVISIKHQDSAASAEIVLEGKTYDLLGNVLTATDGNGNTVTMEYNKLGKVRKETHSSDDIIAQDIITYQYDVVGNLKSKIDSLLRQELCTYDNEGRVLSKTEQKSDGTEAITISVRYDKAGNPRFEADGNGNVLEKTYDQKQSQRLKQNQQQKQILNL